MNRLHTRLALAFSAVTLIGVLVAGVMTARQLGDRFRSFARRNQLMVEFGGDSESLLNRLGEWYDAHGGWVGVETVLAQTGAGAMGRGMGRAGRAVILADAHGIVIYDGSSDQVAPGHSLTEAEKQVAMPVISGSRTVGLLVTRSPGWAAMTRAARAFLLELRATIARAVVLALVVGVVAGLLMSRWLAGPLARASAAARGIAHGERGVRLPEEGVAELAELGRAFNEMTDSLVRSEELRAQMVADIAHELRTPLTVIQGNLRAMLDDVYAVDKAEITRVYDESRRLGRLVEDLRDLAHAEAGQLQLRRAPVDLAELLARSAGLFAEIGRERSIRVTFVPDKALPIVLADHDRLGQVVANLLANSVRHAPDGGQVTVSASTCGTAVRVTVADDGPGLAPDDRERVFDRFWRAEGSRSRSAGGCGLGLAIARQIIGAHGGSIGVDSMPGAGAAFWFTLPVAGEAAMPAADQRTVPVGEERTGITGSDAEGRSADDDSPRHGGDAPVW